MLGLLKTEQDRLAELIADVVMDSEGAMALGDEIMSVGSRKTDSMIMLKWTDTKMMPTSENIEYLSIAALTRLKSYTVPELKEKPEGRTRGIHASLALRQHLVECGVVKAEEVSGLNGIVMASVVDTAGFLFGHLS
jgi:hypothetical protein